METTRLSSSSSPWLAPPTLWSGPGGNALRSDDTYGIRSLSVPRRSSTRLLLLERQQWGQSPTVPQLQRSLNASAGRKEKKVLISDMQRPWFRFVTKSTEGFFLFERFLVHVYFTFFMRPNTSERLSPACFQTGCKPWLLPLTPPTDILPSSLLVPPAGPPLCHRP